MKRSHKESEYMKGFKAGIEHQKSKGLTLDSFVMGTALGICDKLTNFSENPQCPVIVQIIKK